MSSLAPEPILRIGTLEDALPPRGHSLTTPVSIALHVAGLAALFLVPVLRSGELPPPASGVRAFLVEPPSIVAPPPPPPPAPSAATRPVVVPPSTAARFVAPVATPDSIVPEAGLEMGVEGGVPGGVEGGVEGGVVGGIIGGLPAAPLEVSPVRVGGRISEPKKVKHVAPQYPDLALKAKIRGVVILEALIGPDGRVQDLTVLRGVPLLDEAASKAVRQWVYTPTLLDGVPVPVIMTVTVNFHFTT